MNKHSLSLNQFRLIPEIKAKDYLPENLVFKISVIIKINKLWNHVVGF